DDPEDLLSLAALQDDSVPFHPDERAALHLVAYAVQLLGLVPPVLDDREGIDAGAGRGAQELGIERSALRLRLGFGDAWRIEDVLRGDWSVVSEQTLAGRGRFRRRLARRQRRAATEATSDPGVD